MFCASVVYGNEEGRFDVDYFTRSHAPLFARLLGQNCIRYEVHRPLTTPDGPSPPFRAAAFFWVESGEGFGRALAEHGAVIYADIPRFTDLEPTRGWSEVTMPSGS